ncbi:tripartite tricarboxylate transporter TctB family protein [Salinicola sp. MIT1003]|uniref:tripartite tricarboxylate transporter TctB family protein n=1 Tax=Salinicola sp. MIT1003 TaxID=1882734 RepID=UPI0008DC88C6|nr:tripartite tricarboxylate transporter TctB family protein [Salinicola sp. MIT1003]OHZ01815.1 tripartite tricarboxylate transporter [Salinicola sp. MIT1003]
MESQWLSLLDVSIDFDQSHLFFPRIVTWILVILLAMIVITRYRLLVPGLKRAGRVLAGREGEFDHKRFFGTLALTTAYFYLMSVLSDVFPNTGYSFLIMSVAFVFLLSLLYVDHLTRRLFVILVLNALIAPALAWYVLAQLFRITLP